MKKVNIYHLFMLTICALAMAACQKIDIKSFNPEDPVVSFTQQQVTVSNETEEIELDINANLPWRIRTNATWIQLIKANGMPGEKAKISIQRNRVTEERTATIEVYITEVSKDELLLIQAAGDPAPDYTQHFYVKSTGTTDNDGLSWNAAITLDEALDRAADGDLIHIAAGTYTPTVPLTGATAGDTREYTFEIRTNVNLIGGYPANAQGDEVADPEANPTILSGNVGLARARHVIVVTAPKVAEHDVWLQGLTIRDGNAGGTGSVTVNGTAFSRQHGGGMIIGNAKVHIDNCQIIENGTDNHAAGMYIANQSIVTIKNSSISKNSASIAASNGGGIWNDGSTLYLYNSTINENRIGGVGAGIYALNTTRTTYTYMYNVTISNNVTGIFGQNSAAAGYYGRELSEGVMVNCTVYGNTAGGTGAGGGIQLYGSAKLDIYSSTITRNSGAVGSTAVAGSGINVTTTGTNVLNLYNSIVSGNTGAHGQIVGSIASISSTIVDDKVYDVDGAIIAGTTFNSSTMLGALADNGGFTNTVLPIGTNNPTIQYGLSLLQLQMLSTSHNLEEEYVVNDQNNRSRANKTVIGAALPL